MGSVLQALVENLHRQDLTPLEESAAYSQMIEDFSLTHEQVAQRVGKSRSAVSNSLRLLSLPASIQSLLADGRLSAGHAKALLGTRNFVAMHVRDQALEFLTEFSHPRTHCGEFGIASIASALRTCSLIRCLLK